MGHSMSDQNSIVAEFSQASLVPIMCCQPVGCLKGVTYESIPYSVYQLRKCSIFKFYIYHKFPLIMIH